MVAVGWRREKGIGEPRRRGGGAPLVKGLGAYWRGALEFLEIGGWSTLRKGDGGCKTLDRMVGVPWRRLEYLREEFRVP